MPIRLRLAASPLLSESESKNLNDLVLISLRARRASAPRVRVVLAGNRALREVRMFGGALHVERQHGLPEPPTAAFSSVHVPTKLVTDLALRVDAVSEKISRRFYEHPDEFVAAFTQA